MAGQDGLPLGAAAAMRLHGLPAPRQLSRSRIKCRVIQTSSARDSLRPSGASSSRRKTPGVNQLRVAAQFGYRANEGL
jgi:hypothetical protein